MTHASSGLDSISLEMDELALLTVASSRNEPICMMMEISAAASYSPMITDAVNATATRTSAVISWSRNNPIMAPMTMGTPHITIGIQTRNHRSSTNQDMDKAMTPMTMVVKGIF